MVECAAEGGDGSPGMLRGTQGAPQRPLERRPESDPQQPPNATKGGVIQMDYVMELINVVNLPSGELDEEYKEHQINCERCNRYEDSGSF